MIPADLVLLLRRQALSDYALACEDARSAAEQCIASIPTADALVALRSCRARVSDAENALDALGDDVADRDAPDVTVSDRDLVITRVEIMLGRLSRDLESSETEILAAADSIKRLRALLDELGPG